MNVLSIKGLIQTNCIFLTDYFNNGFGINQQCGFKKIIIGYFLFKYPLFLRLPNLFGHRLYQMEKFIQGFEKGFGCRENIDSFIPRGNRLEEY